MRPAFVPLSLLLGLALGCARTPKPVAAPPTPPVAESARSGVIMAVRDVPAPVFADPERRAKIDVLLPAIRDEIARFVAADQLVGLAVGIVVDGELVFGEGFGVRNIEQGGAIDARTAFRIGSITKVFTTMTALRLAEEGRLDLDIPAANYLPELNTLVYPSRDARPLTVRDIVTHTSGLPRGPDLPPLVTDRAPTRDELMQAIDGLSLVRVPGVDYEYSNLGFNLLGHILAGASGQPYHDTIRQAILAPLGMQHTVWERADVPEPQLAIGHSIDKGAAVVDPPTRHGALDAAGGLFSTVEDLARFVAFQLAAWPPRGDDDVGPLHRATLRSAHELRAFSNFRARTVPTELAPSGVEGGVAGVGLGWHVRHGCEQPHVVVHNGAVDGYHATVSMLPHAGVGIIVLGNASWADTDRIADDIQRALDRGKALTPRAPRALPELAQAAALVTGLLGGWDEQTFAAWSTQPLRVASSRKQIAERMQWLHEALGPCALDPIKRAASPWSGVFPLQCERGRAELTLALTSASAPKISSVSVGWLGGTPTPAVREAATAAAALLEQFDEAKYYALFSRALQRTAVERLFTRVRFEYGACKLGDVVEVSGPNEATFVLACDKGKAKLTVAIEREPPLLIRGFRISPNGSTPPCR